MADNLPPTPKGGPMPPLPSSGTTGRLPSPTTHLPVKKGGLGKFVVMLSSVAKPPPDDSEPFEGLLEPSPKPTSADPSQQHPPTLPPKQVTPADSPQSQPRLSSTTYVKLPPKTKLPPEDLPATPGDKESALSAASKATPSPLPAKWSEPIRSEPKKSGAQHIPPIKLNEPAFEADDSSESIFPKAEQPKRESGPKPEVWKSLEPGELNPPARGQQSREVFERSQPILNKPTPKTPLPEAKDKAAPLVAPPLVPPPRVVTPEAVVAAMRPVRPPPLPPPVAKPAESVSAPPPPLQIAPPMLEKAPEPPAEKLPQPNFPEDARKGETDLSNLSEMPGVQKVPALIQPEVTAVTQPPPALPPKPPVLPPALPSPKEIGNLLKKSTPIVVSSSSPKVEAPKIVEAKPALKPAVLPKRSLLISQEAEAKTSQPPVEIPKATEAAKKSDMTGPAAVAPAASGAPAPQPPETTPPAKLPETGTPSSGKKEKTEAKVSPPQPPPDVPVSTKTTKPLPETRAARAKKRRFMETVVFWAVILPVTVFVLLLASLDFCRETRVEGQIIPPPGMTLNNEVWIVSDFRELASGIAEDLAAERMPLMQEVQERQDHVQRVQADVASREERIRLIQEQIKASKDEIASIGKQATDATQRMWDGEGAQIDAEYQSRFNQLKQTISDRAKSLNLKYRSDDDFPSPEVWANAYRLALYDVPTGVDSVKEHQWLGDVMKQWRDFLKTLDARKEQLREKAALLKTSTGPKVADLNTKIDELQLRSDGAAAEEVPLKAELQQAQADLAQAQAADAGLDDKYYKQLYSLPGEAITKHIPLATNGRLTWVDDDVFAEGEKEHRYWIFARATRPDGRQYWALHHFSIGKNQMLELTIEPTGFISTKALLRPNLSPEEQEQ
jgi:hypothetical protein